LELLESVAGALIPPSAREREVVEGIPDGVKGFRAFEGIGVPLNTVVALLV
jgi:hypothetical protein